MKVFTFLAVVMELFVWGLSERGLAQNSNVKTVEVVNDANISMKELVIIKQEKEMPFEICPKQYLDIYKYYLTNEQVEKADNISQMCSKNMNMKLKNNRVSSSDCELVNADFLKVYMQTCFEKNKYQEYINKFDEVGAAGKQLSMETKYKYLMALIFLQKHDDAILFTERLQKEVALKYGNNSAQYEKILVHKAEIYEKRNLYKQAAACYETILNTRLKAYINRGHPEVYEILDRIEKCAKETQDKELSDKIAAQRAELNKNPWVNAPLVRESYQNASFY
jgi:tetratricopeptide (TPR) repeat protein